ncbi:MAG: GntR family transcriptional regulator [Acidobacteria bacterium]|nr:GntR family transcriptional regulator [Acidobacteriota bacterium]
MLPFRVEIQPGASPYQQVIYAVKKAVVSGRLRPGDRFPSVRALSQELKINPNTAHKAVAALVEDGLLEVHPGVGTVVAAAPPADPAQRRALLGQEIEQLVVEARRLQLDLDDLKTALDEHWSRLGGTSEPSEPARSETPEEKP